MINMRWLEHLTTTRLTLHRCFPRRTRKAIKAAIASSERTHHAEIRFAVETALSLRQLARRLTSRKRALEVFAELGVWDTAQNNGVLIYVLLAEHGIEIVADRGFTPDIPGETWRAICDELGHEFEAGRYEQGVLTAIDKISEISAARFPIRGSNPNELPDEPTMI